jgi:hypothetical protein
MAANDQPGRRWSQPCAQCPLAWSQSGRSFGPSLPDPVSGNSLVRGLWKAFEDPSVRLVALRARRIDHNLDRRLVDRTMVSEGRRSHARSCSSVWRPRFIVVFPARHAGPRRRTIREREPGSVAVMPAATRTARGVRRRRGWPGVRRSSADASRDRIDRRTSAGRAPTSAPR